MDYTSVCGTTKPSRSAFTLIELLVVIAVIALLISILLPSLGAARETARALVCLTKLRGIGQGQALYMNENKDYYAGPNTSGALGQTININPFRLGYEDYLNDSKPSMPTSTHDWISPSMGDSAGLSPNRARRTQEIFSRLGCVSTQRIKNDRLYGGATDSAQFRNIIESEGYNVASYMSPAAFHYKPNEAVANAQKYKNAVLKFGFTTPVSVNPKFRPRIDSVGVSTSNKIMAADGTRYFDTGAVDFDISPNPGIYGSFTDSGPIFEQSTAYGRSFNRAPNRDNVLLSLRHPGKSVNALFFDAHAASIKGDDIYAKVEYWYPSGSKFNSSGVATAESMLRFKDGDLIP